MTGLTNIPALDVAIGLAFLYFVLSTAISMINEAIANVLGWRAKTLEDAVRSLLGEPKARRELGEWFGLVEHQDPRDLSSAVFRHWRVQSLVRNPGSRRRRRGRPSYLPGEVFALALTDALAARTPPVLAGPSAWQHTDDELLARVSAALDGLPDGHARRVLTEATLKADGSVERFRMHLEGAFDAATARASGWYKRKVQIMIVALSAAAVVGLNVDSARIAQRMWSDAPLRSAVAAQAVKPGGDPTSVADAVEKVDQLHLPIGWGAGSGHHGLAQLPGWLLTVAALSIGAPFWFDLLSRFARLRGAGIETKPRRLSDTSGTPSTTA